MLKKKSWVFFKKYMYLFRALTCFDLKSIFNSPVQVLKGCQKNWNFTGFLKNHYSCHRFVVIAVPKVLFDKTLKFLLVMRGNSSHFQDFLESTLIWSLGFLLRYSRYFQRSRGIIYRADRILTGRQSALGLIMSSSVTLSPAPLITATYGIAIY